ncbi:N-acyl-aromatic-L-amino acid amidohydrolase (carboxylate-forming) A [Esox lucius]|uniref:N-acyl-aromatic-L-amino acid amidohydrolase n=1 Tax=Esox lucius TaxID=8010 RepID=A0A3P8Z5F1_ESOLU|nr:N-acyl-aromatic-L-amino acid amidohydrolase (carboxylate-forming) A [Esox lucius]XP_028974116.1 N-acyl-aromatic-L-amino acid amidohydrolase (carboxylate-forming) A [Esox lucius]
MMDPVSLPPLSRIAICGGTHGNEMSGVHLVRELQRQKMEKVGSAALTTVISNPCAIQVCRRYIDKDLNRCFTDAILSSPVTGDTPYEVRRAQELSALLGPKGSVQAMDLVCDLHNSTSNMGLSLITYFNQDPLILHICRHIQRKVTLAPVRLIQLDTPHSDAYSLDSIGKHSFSIEVGPQPHGVIRADIFNIMKEAVDQTLEWVRCFNSGSAFEGAEVDNVYIFVKSVEYPRDPETNHVTAVIHPQLQDRDFCLLRPGDPMFLTFSGDTVKYEGEEVLHPFFVNEGAYYEKNIAFHLGRRITLTIPSLQMKGH